MNLPVVSIITVNSNCKDLTAACLAGLPAGAEVIVVDNGSTDGSADEIAAKFPSATLIRNRSNLGFVRAANQGVAVSKGKYVCLLRNLARHGADALEAMACYLDEHPDAGIVVPRECGYGCMMIRRECLDRTGAFDERYFAWYQERDWVLRAKAAGFKFGAVPADQVEHPGEETERRNHVRARLESSRDMLAWFRKRHPFSYPVIRIALLPWCLLEFIFCTLLIFVRGIPRRWLDAGAEFAWHVCGCPRRWGLSAGVVPRYLQLRDGWVVREGTLEGFGDFDRHFAKARVVKDYRYKKTLACTVADRTYLVKVYKRAGWLRRLKSKVFGSRADHELAMCRGILDRGIPTVPVVAVGERDPGSCVVFEQLDDWAQLQEVLLSEATPAARRRSLLRAYGRFARWVQDLGVWQYDFNPTNVLVKDSSFKLIDFERVKLRARPLPASARIPLLARMNRVGRLSRTDRLRFLKGYVAAHAEEAARLGELAREIVRQGERQKDVDRDHAGDRSVDENRDFARFETPEVAGFYRKVRADGLGDGIELDAILRLARQGGAAAPFRVVEAENAIVAWQEANGRVREGGPLPLAVFRRKGETRGSLIYRA